MSTTIGPASSARQLAARRPANPSGDDDSLSSGDDWAGATVDMISMMIRVFGHTIRVMPECTREHVRWQVQDPYRRVPGGRQVHLFEYRSVRPIGPILGLPKFPKGNVVTIANRRIPVYRNRAQVETLIGTRRSFGVWHTEPFAIRGRVGGQELTWIPPYVLRCTKSTNVLVAGYRSEPGSMLEPLIDAFLRRTGWNYSPCVTDWWPPLHPTLFTSSGTTARRT